MFVFNLLKIFLKFSRHILKTHYKFFKISLKFLKYLKFLNILKIKINYIFIYAGAISRVAYVSFKNFSLTTLYGLNPPITIFGNVLLDL